jgi:NAD(P)H-dependent flavin oxidoreductase YrpB (nitropropane dioxygenase family)
MCGWALARAHAKAGDAAMIAGYLGKSDRLDDALTLYVKAYANQAECDIADFNKAIRSGHLQTDTHEAGGLEFAL